MLNPSTLDYRLKIVFGAVSILVPALVAILLFMPSRLDLNRDFIGLLPGFHAIINSATAVVLILGVYFIKKKNVEMHKKAMLVAFVLGGLFLLSYVTYHASAEPVLFGDANGDGVLSDAERLAVGGNRTVYLLILLSHIVLAAATLPFVLFALYYGLTNRNEKHRKAVKFAFPLWFYVSITGVVVYLMLSPYYQF